MTPCQINYFHSVLYNIQPVTSQYIVHLSLFSILNSECVFPSYDIHTQG